MSLMIPNYAVSLHNSCAISVSFSIQTQNSKVQAPSENPKVMALSHASKEKSTEITTRSFVQLLQNVLFPFLIRFKTWNSSYHAHVKIIYHNMLTCYKGQTSICSMLEFISSINGESSS